MTTVAPTMTTPTPTATPVQTPPVPPQTGVISSDFQTFLTMLTTQLQNQDPLNPVESSDFAVQLATFSGVEQQVIECRFALCVSCFQTDF